jgi:hypothetical protein
MPKDNDDDTSNTDPEQQTPSVKPKKSALSKVKKTLKTKKDVGVIIQIKGQDGNL